MNSQKYWRQRVLYEKKKQIEASADYELAMRARLKDLEKEFEKEAYKYISLYAKANNENIENAAKYLKSIDTSKWDMTLEEFEAKARAGGYDRELDSAYYKSRIARLQKLHDQFSQLASKYADKEEDRFALRLAKQYQDTYAMDQYTKYLAVGGLDINFAQFNEQQLKNLVYKPWQGSNFSTRVWNNYTKVLPDVLSDALLRGTLMGYSYSRIEKDIRDRFTNFETKNVHRLVITEMGHAAEEATAQFYEDSHIEKYQYLATLESHTCDVCAHLDEKVFNVKDKIEGLNYPLIHPYCRCTTVPYDESLPDIISRWERDPITDKGKLVKNQTYKEWAHANNTHVMTLKEFKQAHNVKPLSLAMLKALPHKSVGLLSALLNNQQRKAIVDYISPKSYILNDSLRNGYPLNDDLRQMISNLDSALNKLPKYKEDQPLYRSLDINSVEDLREFFKDKSPGNTYSSKQYISTSKETYSPDAKVQIIIKHSKNGVDLVGYGLEDEKEVLFKRNTKFKVVDRYIKDQKIYLVVIEVD